MQLEDQVDHPANKDQTRGVSDNGLGRAIVFLHGFLAGNDLWKDFSKPLQKEYRIISIELPGHGTSPESAVGKSLEQMADYVHEIIGSLRVEKCLLVGHSMGGYVALALAEKYPEMLAGLCLFHSSALPDPDDKKQNRDKTIEFMRSNGMEKFAETFVKPLFHSSSHDAQKDMIGKLEKLAANIKTEEAIASLEAMRDRPDRTQVLKSLDCPVLFFFGKDDDRYQLSDMAEQASMPKNSQAHFMGDTSHMGMLERNEQTVLILEQFADRVFDTIRI